MKYVTAKECTVIPIGRQGENNAETVLFDVTGWAETYGAGAFALLHQRCSDPAPYECPITVEDGFVNWVVRNADTALVGYGKAELVYVVDSTVAKSVIYQTSTLKSLDGSADFPDPYDDWLRQIHDDAEYVREHIEDALEAEEESEAWAVGKRSGVDVPDTDETYHNNSKWYAEEAAAAVAEAAQEAEETSEAWATGKRGGEDVGSTDPAYHNNSKYYAEQAGQYETAAGNSAEDAANSAREAASFVGAPLVASTASAMTDHTRVYVYVGSETGYTSGHWYYWNGSAWTDGGVYNSIADDIATSADLQTLYT